MPVTSHPRVAAAYLANPPQPQPMSSRRSPALSSSLSHNISSLITSARSRSVVPSKKQHVYWFHGPEEVGVHAVVEVVVFLGHGARPVRRLQVREPGLQRLEGARRADQRLVLGVGGQDAAEHLVEGVAVPVAVDIGLADAERAAQRPAIQPVAVHADVPGTVAVDPDARARDQSFEQRLEDSVRHGKTGGILNRGGRRMTRPGRTGTRGT